MYKRQAIRRIAPTKAIWESQMRSTVKTIAESLAGCRLSGQEVTEFLTWNESASGAVLTPSTVARRDNIYRYKMDEREVKIKVGSIHSVKGQTHTATLVLETFWHAHNLKSLLPWLCGSKSGGQTANPQLACRLKLHYVAMTRPTHLLCCAMKVDSFKDKDGNIRQDMFESLKKRGWHIEMV